jgi:hypothetical protein
VLDAEFGERVARRLAALVEPSFDRLMAKMEAVLAGIGEVNGRLLLIEEHYRSCPAREGVR